ncbi:MAG: lytic transglycosylase domain-containing protein [Verrucomicrobiia bacterium]|jgi:membrane-bound lytic murein transglycosylase D
MIKNILKIPTILFLIYTAIGICKLNSAEDAIDLNELMNQGEKFINENIDDNILESIKGTIDINDFFKRLQNTLSGEYVIDLASLRDAAKVALPILDSYEETKPYADWLRTRLEYFEAASELKLYIGQPEQKPGEPPKPLPNPSPELERKVWQKRLEKTPVPQNAKPYLNLIKTIFLDEKIPAELVWIAEVESGFNPRARSPVGAVGLFQIMPETARRFGLSTFPFDERTNPEKSARAAAKYLRYLSDKFKDWKLALAAYNVGEGRVQRLLANEKTKSFESIATRLPAETQMYVPRIEATVFRREGVKLTDLPLIVRK